MRTSSVQFKLLVDFMKRNGDLSKPPEGPRERASNLKSWCDLTEILNADAYGYTKTVDKWRKVWSDLKNNTKKKTAHIRKAAGNTGARPVSKLKLSVLEKQILQIITPQEETGMAEVIRIGLDQVQQEFNANTQDSRSELVLEAPVANPSSMENEPESKQKSAQPPSTFSLENSTKNEVLLSASVNCTATAAPPRVSETSSRTTRRRLRRDLLQNESSPTRGRRTQKQAELSKQAFVSSDSEWRYFQQKQQNENVKLRQKELRQQQQWLDLLAQFVGFGNRFLNYLENK